MTLTMNELLSPGFITAYILGLIFLALCARFAYDSFSEYLKDLTIVILLLLGFVFCYVAYNQQLSGQFDIKETIKGNH